MTYATKLLLAGCSATVLSIATTVRADAQTTPSTGVGTSDTSAQSAREATTASPDRPGQAVPVAGPATSAEVASDGTQLQEIVVTAQKRAQNLQKVPIAVAAVSGEDLKTRGIETVTDLGTSVSGLEFQRVNGIVLPFLRGIGNTGNAAGNEPSVATYIDGVYFPRVVSSFFDLKNLERVEVLKGPQGTLFGRNSTGGVINVITRNPSQRTAMSASVSYGRFNAVQGDAYVTTGLTQNLAIDLAVSGKTSDGFGNDIATGHRYGFEDSILVRSKLLWTPAETTRILLSGFYSDSKQSHQRAAFPGFSSRSNFPPVYVLDSKDISFYDGTSNPDNINKFRVGGGSLRIEQQVGFANLASITSYSTTVERSNFDFDFLPTEDGNVIGRGPTNVFSQEVQLTNKPGSPFDWIVGTYYYHNRTGYNDLEFTGPAFGPGIRADSRQKTSSISGFAQATVEVLPKLKLTGGIRYTHDHLAARGIFQLFNGFDLGVPPPGENSIGKVTFKAAADYQFSSNILGYASFSRGFKSGNYGLLTYNRAQPTRPEGIDAYEVGLKTELFDRHVRLNGALFYYDISNPQVALIDLATNTIFFSNAGGSRVKGAEADAQFAIVRGLTARASATYLDSKYTDYLGAPSSIPDLVNGGSVPIPGGIDAKGNRTPLASKLTFNVGADYTIETSAGDVTLTADWYHNSGYFFEPDNLLHQPSYELVNAQVRWKVSRNYAVRVFGRNLVGEKIIAGAASYQGPLGFAYVPSPPRTWGVALDVDF
ncbi:TonB-dependent receptor [Sphingomonas sp.]|uniref:TonB-dependent receptor n=1 Tax=Sphingomonas sp. TaxID=28214 RepID=UPI003B005F7F